MCCPRSTQINIIQSQTLPNIKRDQYKQLSYQPKPSQASQDASDRASEDPRFSTFLKCVVPDHPISTLDSPRHFQTSKGTNTNNFPVNQNHPRRPQTPLTEPQKIQDFQFFGNRSSYYDPPRLHWQLQLLTFLTKIIGYYMDKVVWGKRCHNKSEKMAELNCRA